MIRIIKIILIGTVIFHIVRTTYEVNVLEQKIQSINSVLVRIERQVPGWPNDNGLKRDAKAGLDTLEKNYPGAPHASDEFVNRLNH
jgi:hypothetical protein